VVLQTQFLGFSPLCDCHVFLFYYFIYCTNKPAIFKSIVKRENINFVLILCDGDERRRGNDIVRQTKQTEVLLKSSVLFTTRKKLHFHIIADSKKVYKRVVNITSNWPSIYKNKIEFKMYKVWYPKKRKNMISMFRVCATERLFLPEIFHDLDRVIFIDTDIIFLRPPEDLWSHFHDFSDKHIAGLTMNLNRYKDRAKQKIRQVPYFGNSGINAGIMMMDLTRMRLKEVQFIEANLAMYDRYKQIIKLADQDILNSYFHFNPDLLYVIPCDWNYRSSHCSQGKHKCKSAERTGVSMLHGNAQAFVDGREMKFVTMFEAFENFKLGVDDLSHLYLSLVAYLRMVEDENLKSDCKKVPNIDEYFLSQLKQHVNMSQQDLEFHLPQNNE